MEKEQARCDERIASYKAEIELRQKNTTKDHYFAIDMKIYGKEYRNQLAFEIIKQMKNVAKTPG